MVTTRSQKRKKRVRFAIIEGSAPVRRKRTSKKRSVNRHGKRVPKKCSRAGRALARCRRR